MRVEQLEAWVLSIVGDVARGRAVEDSRVELKSRWPDPRSAARRIAGHANASGGDSVLWIIGLNEKEGVVAVESIDVAEWRSRLAAEFNGLEPTFIDLMIPTPNGVVIALLFDTTRRPYVVKNAVHGTPGGGAVSLEVPWREGTSIRSARREDLIRILTPQQALPAIEVLSATTGLHTINQIQPGMSQKAVSLAQTVKKFIWTIRLVLYVTPRTPEVLVLPVHRTRLSLALGDGPVSLVTLLSFRAPTSISMKSPVRDSHTVVATNSEAILNGPGRLWVYAWHYEAVRLLDRDDDLTLALSILAAGQDRSIDITVTLLPRWAPGNRGIWTWYADHNEREFFAPPGAAAPHED